MRTFFTSSLLAMLSAVVVGWYLVKTGGETPRRSPDSYPAMVAAEVSEEETEEAAPNEVDGSASAPEIELDEPSEAEPRQAIAKRIPDEPFGPPAPVLPFVLNINAAEEEVSVQGSIPTREMKAAISGAIASAFEEKPIDDRLKFSPETRSGLWIRDLPEFIKKYFQYTGGNHEVTIVDGKLILAGAVATEEAKETILGWAKPLKSHGLTLVEAVDVDENLAGEITEIPGKLTKAGAKKKASVKAAPPEMTGEEGATEEVVTAIQVDHEKSSGEKEVAPEFVASGKDVETEATEGLVFLAPFDEQYQVHTVPDRRPKKEDEVQAREESQVYVSETREPGGGIETEAAEVTTAKPFVDDGGPLIFEFDSPSGEIINSHREKIEIAIKRAQLSRSIIYVTGYSDYRGNFEQNQKLALTRANRIKDLIFANDIADQVTVEVKTLGDVLSRKKPGRETEEELSRSRRVVVEVYHLR